MPPAYAQEEEEEEEIEPEQSARGKVDEDVFKDEDGHPICFFIHPSIKDVSIIRKLTRDIKSCGGMVLPTHDRVDTVLVKHQGFKDKLQQAYSVSLDKNLRRIWVELPGFVKECIGQGLVKHRIPKKLPMGGTFGARTEFTEEDDQHLARYLAIRIPDKEAGGRSGNKIYQDMVSLGDLPGFDEYRWVKRHPWKSWRNRYNRKMAYIDGLIDQFLAKQKSEEKQHFPFDRRVCRQYLDHARLMQGEDGERQERIVSPPRKRARLNNSLERPTKVRLGQDPRSEDKTQKSDPVENDYRSLFGDSQEEEFALPEKQKLQLTTRRLPSQQLSSNTQASQATLVASPSQSRLQRPQSRATVLEALPPPQQIENRFLNALPDIVPSLTVHEDHPTVPSPMSFVQSTRHVDSVNNPPLPNAGQNAMVGPRINLTGAPGNRRHRAIKTASQSVARRLSPTTAVLEAPYRNTRSRTRSMSPTLLASTNTKLTDERTKATRLAQLAEAPNEEDAQSTDSQNVSNSPVSVQENIEEMVVEDILVNNTGERSRFAKDISLEEEQQANIASTSTFTPPNESEPVDSDDQQTNHHLRRPPKPSSSQRPVSLLAADDPDDVLKEFIDGARIVSSLRHTASNARSNASGPSRNALEAAMSPTPKSGMQSYGRGNSTTSTESFPTAGTKAREVKSMIEKEQKHTPYKAPSGTRAALHASNTRR